MVVVNSRAGHRSNRLVVAAHAMATAIVCGERLRLTSFDEFKDDYACEAQLGIRVVIKKSRFWEWVRLAERFATIFLGLKRVTIPHVLTLASSWGYRNASALAKCEDEVRAFFKPLHVEQTGYVLKGLKDKGDILVGVHVRRTDYKTFLCGRYYFEDDVYCREMCNAQGLLAKRGTVLFVVFSDECLDESHFDWLPCYFQHGSAVEDQWMMSQCDFLMGPPSTFSAWASFMGKVPLARMWDKDYKLKEEDFAYRGLVA